VSTVNVDVVSAWYSKINWTQAVAAGASLLTATSGGQVGLDANQQLSIVTGITLVQGLVTWVFKTWFTSTVTPSSAAKT
jgi:hypothetical protein